MAKSNTAGINPFASAQRKTTATSKKAAGNLIFARDITAYDGAKYTKQQVSEAVDAYSEGHKLFEQGKAMKDTNRPIIIAVGRTEQASKWLMQGSRPTNPKLHLDETGAGQFISIVFMDSVNKLDDDSYASLANVIGAQAAEENTTRRDDFSINPELLGEKCKVVVDGKHQELTVMDAIAAVLNIAFQPSPHILANLFHVTPKFETVKGLIDKGLQFLPDKTPSSASRLAQFLEAARFTTQLKPGGSDD